MKIYLDESPPASGKTYRAIQSITQIPCKCLFITERIDRFDELEQDIRNAASVSGTSPEVVRVSSNKDDYSNTVAQKIESLPDDYKNYGHVIVLATQAAMLRSNFSGFGVWQIIVDEVPPFVDFEEKRTHLDAAFFQKYYRLEPVKDNWSVIRLTKAGERLTVANVRADESHKHLGVFHGRVIEASRDDPIRFVLCNLPKWEDMSASKVSWCWASTFSLWELEPFDRVVLLGNRFRKDIGNILSETMSVQPIEWEELPPLTRKAEFLRRAVHIHYFSETRRSSRCCFDTDEGQVMLREIGAYLLRVLPSDNSIWTANKSSVRGNTMTPRCAMVEGGLSDKNYLPPRQAGTNNHMGKSHAAMIYSAKPSPHLVALLKMLNVPVELWAASVEHETVLQFMSRTSVRDKDNSSPVHLWVFDRDQALFLKEHFDSLDYVTTTVQLVADGPAIPTQSKRGPKAAVRTPEEQAEFVATKRRKDAERNRRNRAKKKQVMTMQQAA